MKYYEECMKPFRLAFEEAVLPRPQITTKKMLGCPCYKANGKLFTLLVTNGLVIINLSQTDREELSRQLQTTPSKLATKALKNGPRYPSKPQPTLNRSCYSCKEDTNSHFKKHSKFPPHPCDLRMIE